MYDWGLTRNGTWNILEKGTYWNCINHLTLAFFAVYNTRIVDSKMNVQGPWIPLKGWRKQLTGGREGHCLSSLFTVLRVVCGTSSLIACNPLRDQQFTTWVSCPNLLVRGVLDLHEAGGALKTRSNSLNSVRLLSGVARIVNLLRHRDLTPAHRGA